MNKIQGVSVITHVEYEGEILSPFSDEENLYIPQVAVMTHGAEPYWLEIPLSLIRGNIGNIDMVVNAPEEMKTKL